MLGANGLVDDALAHVFVDGVVGNEAGCGSGSSNLWIGVDLLVDGGALGIEVLIVIGKGRKEASAGDGVVQRSVAAGSDGGGEVGLVGASAVEGFVESNG